MMVTLDTLVSEILDERPEAVEVFAKHGVAVETECHGCLDNPLDLCETMCDVDDMEALLRDLQALFTGGSEAK